SRRSLIGGTMPAVANARERIDRTVPVLDERYRRLSRREREVGALVVFGMSRREIADELNISPRTVDTHKLHVLAKLECANDVALVRWAFVASAAPLATEAFAGAVEAAEIVDGFVSWHLECACDWRSVSTPRPLE